MKKTFLKSRKYKLSNDMQHFHVHLDLPYHSNESPIVIWLGFVRLCWVYNEFENSDEKSQNFSDEMSIG